MKRIGFITCEEEPKLISDDLLVAEPLRRYGIELEPVVWDISGNEVGELDALVFRSCWNYHRKHAEFLRWCETLQRFAIPIWNSAELVPWSLHKGYLLELRDKGAWIPTSRVLPRGFETSAREIENLTGEIGARDLVVKPAVSLSGYDTHLIPSRDHSRLSETIAALVRERDVIVQEFLPEVRVTGELSFVFFDRVFSHAVRKLPKQGEFRIHEEHGGSRQRFVPSAELVAKASDILSLVAGPLLYARVDVVERGDELLLMELEIIDPMLFLGLSDEGPERFASVIAARF